MDTQSMPPEIAKAVVKVMGEVKKLGKDTRNAHGGYNYVSVDQFFDQVGKLMSDAGIWLDVNEVESSIEVRETTDQYGKTKKSAWLAVVFDIYVVHESGAVHGPRRRHQQVQATGPQSYGSCSAYAEKYYMRNLFKIPTGEQDADQDAQEGLPARARKIAPPPPPRNDTTLEASQAARDAMLDELTAILTDDELAAWFARAKPAIEKLLEADKQVIRDAYSDTKQALKGKAAA